MSYQIDPSAVRTYVTAINCKRTARTQVIDGTVQVTYGSPRDSDPRRNDLVELGDRVTIAMALENKTRPRADKPISDKAARIQRMLAKVAAVAADDADDAPEDDAEAWA